MVPDSCERILKLLASVAESDEVRTNPQLPLYDKEILDSMKTVELMIELENEFGLEISPAEFERELWATPEKMILDIERRMRA
ncbi:MAG TPA: D-alanine--poly(phosphoribitol) ligase subunit DltC [Chthoniobacterales bacterium]|jgi:D-alanine--poly(phosphoribitol) ligase subunit 2